MVCILTFLTFVPVCPGSLGEFLNRPPRPPPRFYPAASWLLLLQTHALISRWSPRIPPLLQVRQLQSLALPIKKEILAEVETAAKFYR